MDGGWCSSVDAGICLCIWGPASGTATSTGSHILHSSFGHDHNIMGMDVSRVMEMSHRDHGKDWDILRNGLWQKYLPTHQVCKCQSRQERFWMSFKSGYLFPVHLMKY